MTHTVSDNILDLALGQIQAGEPPNQVLGSYPGSAGYLGPLLEAAWTLKVIDPVEFPDVQAISHDRNAFLVGVTGLHLQSVSSSPLAGLKGWILFNIPWLFPDSGEPRLKVRQMSFLFLKVALVFTVLFWSVGGVMVAAEDSLPDSPIYALKLVREQARLAMNSDPAKEAALHLNLAQTRIQEMIRTAARGDVPQEVTMTRLQTHMSEAFRNTAQTADEPMEALLFQAQEMTRLQEQALTQAQEQANEKAQTRLRETARQMSQWRQDAEEGLQDPHQFRLRFGHNGPEDAPGPGGPGVYPDCNDDCDQNGDGNQYGQDAEDPPSDHSYGPGQPGGNPDCSGDCGQNGDGNRYGQDAKDPPPGPGPGQPGGNPDCSGDCDQSRDGNQFGQDAEDPPPGSGPGQPGGNPDCSGDCDQSGDGNQYGQDAEEPPPGPGPGQPGGNPDCSGDCDQSGDSNQYGQDAEDPPPGPSPGQPGGNPECSGDCDQSGSESPGGQSGGGKTSG